MRSFSVSALKRRFRFLCLEKKTTTAMPTERTVKRAVTKVAKDMHLKREERQQVAAVLTQELQQRAQAKKQAAHRPAGQVSGIYFHSSQRFL